MKRCGAELGFDSGDSNRCLFQCGTGGVFYWAQPVTSAAPVQGVAFSSGGNLPQSRGRLGATVRWIS